MGTEFLFGATALFIHVEHLHRLCHLLTVTRIGTQTTTPLHRHDRSRIASSFRLNRAPTDGAGVRISSKSCSFFPITFLSSDLRCVITARTVIFTFPHSESFNPGPRTDRQSITGLFTWPNPPRGYCVTLLDLVLFLTLYQQSSRRELRNSLWQLIVLLICNVNSGYYISSRY